MDDHTTHPDARRFAETLVRWAGGGALIIDHMSRHECPDAPEGPLDTLTRLIAGTLEPMAADRHGFAAAADVLAEAVELIGQDLFLVDSDALAEDAAGDDSPV